jgi:hypothetical protein
VLDSILYFEVRLFFLSNKYMYRKALMQIELWYTRISSYVRERGTGFNFFIFFLNIFCVKNNIKMSHKFWRRKGSMGWVLDSNMGGVVGMGSAQNRNPRDKFK